MASRLSGHNNMLLGCGLLLLSVLLLQAASVLHVLECEAARAGVSSARTGQSTVCRCLPGSDCWPSTAAWQQLNSSLDGRLLSPLPPASACYDSQGIYSPTTASCQAAITNWTNPFWRVDQPGGMQCPNWESSSVRAFNHTSCPLLSADNSSSPVCQQGAVPVYAVEVLQASHVQTAVAFAAQHNLRLTIKNTGHDYLGRSMAEGSLNLWMHRMKSVTFHDSFLPDGCSNSSGDCAPASAVTATAGVQWKQLYEAADANGKVVVGGMSATVGSCGGFLQGGGHGPLSPLLGFAADNVLQLTVVTADGELRTANSFQNRDLFWALRGGGGGTFGVVTSVTYKTHPALASVLSVQYQIQASTASAFEGLLIKIVELQPALSEAGPWSGYQAMLPSPMSVTLTYMLPNGASSDNYTTPFQPLITYAEEHSDEISLNSTVLDFPSLVEWHSYALCQYNPGVCSDPAGANLLLASRLFQKQVMAESSEEIGKALTRIVLSTTQDFGDVDGEEKPVLKVLTGQLVSGRAVTEVPEDYNAMNPAFRKAIWSVVLSVSWEDGAGPDEIAAKARGVTELNGLLRELTPTSGSYLNEADVDEPQWQTSFFNQHYPLLRRIKARVDPDGLFVCTRCVGSEDWTDDLNCRILSTYVDGVSSNEY